MSDWWGMMVEGWFSLVIIQFFPNLPLMSLISRTSWQYAEYWEEPQSRKVLNLSKVVVLNCRMNTVRFSIVLTWLHFYQVHKHKHCTSIWSVTTQAPELILIHVVQGHHMTSELFMRLNGAEILCSSYRKWCLPTGISIRTSLEVRVNQAAAVQTYTSERQHTYTNMHS